MNFARRKVERVIIELVPSGKIVVDAVAKPVHMNGVDLYSITVYAHKDDETEAQLFGIEIVNLQTGEVSSRQINLARQDSYAVTIVEILAVEK